MARFAYGCQARQPYKSTVSNSPFLFHHFFSFYVLPLSLSILSLQCLFVAYFFHISFLSLRLILFYHLASLLPLSFLLFLYSFLCLRINLVLLPSLLIFLLNFHSSFLPLSLLIPPTHPSPSFPSLLFLILLLLLILHLFFVTFPPPPPPPPSPTPTTILSLASLLLLFTKYLPPSSPLFTVFPLRFLSSFVSEVYSPFPSSPFFRLSLVYYRSFFLPSLIPSPIFPSSPSPMRPSYSAKQTRDSVYLPYANLIIIRAQQGIYASMCV